MSEFVWAEGNLCLDLLLIDLGIASRLYQLALATNETENRLRLLADAKESITAIANRLHSVRITTDERKELVQQLRLLDSSVEKVRYSKPVAA